MFLEASVSQSVHRVGRVPPWRQTPLCRQTPVVLTSSGGHCSGRYASYWNAFLFESIRQGVKTCIDKKPYLEHIFSGWSRISQRVSPTPDKGMPTYYLETFLRKINSMEKKRKEILRNLDILDKIQRHCIDCTLKLPQVCFERTIWVCIFSVPHIVFVSSSKKDPNLCLFH